MPKNLTMPRLSDTMEQGTIVKWHIKPGQKVKSGDVIADIETDKATMEMQTFEDGVVAALDVKEGQQVPVGTLILSWEGGTGGAEVKGGSAKAPAVAASAGGSASVGGGASTAVAEPDHAGHANGSAGHSRVFASPLARKIAADSGVDLSGIQGSGPSGRIVRKDVEAVLGSSASAPARKGDDATPPPMPAPGRSAAPSAPARGVPAPSIVPPAGLTRRLVPLSNMRRTIAARLVESKTTIPHYQVTVSVRMDALSALRSQLNEQLAAQGVKLSVNDFLVRACALAMHQHPYVNARWVGTKGAEAIEYLDRVNIGVAIALPIAADGTGGGLVVATLRNADAMGLRAISSGTKSLADKARGKGLSIDEMSDSTFTISNLGMFGVDHFTAIVNPPNAAILAVGAAIEGPVVETDAAGNKKLVIGTTMSMTMSSDHRIIDGAMAAQYLQTVKAMLEKPATLLV
jgi:pyruvate dehydrogenase E2 component (dihydrolipoamide acetyltransferase)